MSDRHIPDDIKLRIQALVDNELPASEIRPTLELIRADTELQDEYVELLRIKRRIGPGPATRIPEAWVEQAEKSIRRRSGRIVGIILLVGSYVLLLGYALFTLFSRPGTPLIVAILISSSVLGFLFLLFNAIADRMRERRDDRYREVMR
jgi:hypothetical protein